MSSGARRLTGARCFRFVLAREGENDADDHDVHHLVDSDHQPEELIDRLFVGALDHLDPPDHRPPAVEEHVRPKDEQEPCPVDGAEVERRHEAEGIA